MRTYSPIRAEAAESPALQRELHKLNVYLRQQSTQTARTPAFPQGTPSFNGGGTVNLDNFLYLPGRQGGQFSKGRVSFETKQFGAGGSAAVPTQDGIQFQSNSPTDGTTTIFFSVEETAAGRPLSPTRDWIFPAFNTNSTGPLLGYHFFVDATDYQRISGKLFERCFYGIEDTTNPSGFFNSTFNKCLMLAWGGGYPAGGFNLAAGTIDTPTGVQPSLQIPALDYKDGGVGVRDQTHALAIVKRAHSFSSSSGAPFEPGGLLFGSSSGKELYPMYTTAQGTLAAPSNGQVPAFNAVVNQTVTVTAGSAIATMASTTGITAGMRMRQTANNYSLDEDTHVKSVDSGTQITMSANSPFGAPTAVSIDFFGMTWSTPSGAAHTLLDGSTHSDTVAQTVTRGSLIYGNSTPKWDELPIGTSGKVLTSDGTDVSWQTPSGGSAGFLAVTKWGTD